MMMKVTLDDIREGLSQLKEKFEIRGTVPDGEKQIASVFSPVDGGFYYLSRMPENFRTRNSVILTNPDVYVKATDLYDGNQFIVISSDPQEIFYKLMDHWFSAEPRGYIDPTAVIHPEAELGADVYIGPYCVIGKAKIADHVIIGSHTVIEDNTSIGENTQIDGHSHIGARGIAWIWDEKNQQRIVLPQIGGVRIGKNCILGAGTIIVRGSLNENSVIEDFTVIAPGARLGHGTRIGKYVHLANNVVTGGNVQIGEHSFIGSSATLRPKIRLHPHTIVGAGAVVVKNTSAPGKTLVGVPAEEKETKKRPAGIPKRKNLSS